jgi:deazaflavin-dependent oxidoreductase (nitroreductase family)
MTVDEQPRDRVLEWVAEHTRRYVECDGADGRMWRDGVPTLVLVTRGRRTGDPRRNALVYGADGADHVVVASAGGADHHPVWYLSLLDQPDARVHVGAERFDARARTAADHERPRLWAKMAAIWPDYDRYQEKTDRVIPVVVLERA